MKATVVMEEECEVLGKHMNADSNFLLSHQRQE